MPRSESRGFLFRVRSAVADLIRRTPGLRSVLAHIQKMTHLDPKERHRLENDALARRHAREKRVIERRRRTLARLETRERHSLEKAVKRERRLQEATRLEAAQATRIENRDWSEGELVQLFDTAAAFDREVRDTGDDGVPPDRRAGQLQQKFDAAAGFDRDAHETGDDGLVPDWSDGDLRRHFDTAAGFERDDGDSGDGDDGPPPNKNSGAHGNHKGPGFRRRREKGYGSR